MIKKNFFLKTLFLFYVVLFINNNAKSQSYESFKGIYVEVYSRGAYTGENVAAADGNYNFYFLNKNGVILKASGSSSSNAFRNLESGISSGRIKGGSFKILNGGLRVNWSNGTEEDWSDGYGTGIYVGEGRKLKFLEMID